MHRLLLLLTGLITVAHADFTIVQKIEGGLNSGQMTLRIKDDKARADIAPQVSTITDLGSGETITLQHAAKVFIKIPAEQAQKLFERVRKQQQAVSAEPPKPAPTGRKEKIGTYDCEAFTWSVGTIHATDWVAPGYPNFAAVLSALDKFQGAALAAAARPLQPAMRDLPGLLIKREMTVGAQKTTTTVLSVSDAAVDPAIFIVPADYKEQPAPAFQFEEGEAPK
jgi:hypothetical protein